ncbi:MAG: 3-isopropylmalate dehydrogenase [Pseudomonadota bacterium]
MTHTIAYLPGDGVGPEVAGAARQVIEKATDRFGIALSFKEAAFGGAAIDAAGHPYPDATKEICAGADAILLGAVGGPKWDAATIRPEKGLLEIRQALGLFANLRPIAVMAGMERHSPLKTEIATNTDILIIRELNGGVYYGERVEGNDNASDLCTYSREEVTRIARIAFEAARGRRGKVTSVDKANVLATSRLWRTVTTELQETEYSDVTLEHQLVDSMTMKLITNPSDYDVVLTENMFGDILSDEASVIAGSIGLAPSASLNEKKAGLYEPIHGSAPDIAGQGKANPVGAILSGAMLLRHSLDQEDAAAAIETAVVGALKDGVATGDLGGDATTDTMTAAVLERV